MDRREGRANSEAAAWIPAAPTGPTIPRRQLVALFLYSLVIWSLGNGILPLLPLFARDLGATDVVVGLYLAVSYSAIALGTVVAGWLADRLGHRRTMMLLVGLLAPPSVAATGFVTDVAQLAGLTCLVWYLGGMGLGLTNILGGLSSGPKERGRVLGALALAAPVGSVLGGLSVGTIADALGFSRMWFLLGGLWLLSPLAGLFVHDMPQGSPTRAHGPPRVRLALNRAFAILLLCSLLAAIGSFIGSLGRSLAMQDLAFSNEEITSTVAVSGLVTLPFPPILGILSDRLGRVRFLGLCFAAGIAGLLVYGAASSLWSFWVAASLLAFVAYVSPGVGSALVVDLVDRPSLGRGLALFGATGWTGGVLGFAFGGLAFDRLGNADAFALGALLVAVALALLVPVALAVRSRQAAGSAPSPPVADPRKD